MSTDSSKIKGIDDLQAIKERVLKETSLRNDGYRTCITVHMGTCGIAAGARDGMAAIMDELEKSDRTDIRVTTSGCIGICVQEPVMTIEVLDGESALYGKLDDESARLAFREHALDGKVVTQLVIGKGREQITG